MYIQAHIAIMQSSSVNKEKDEKTT